METVISKDEIQSRIRKEGNRGLDWKLCNTLMGIVNSCKTYEVKIKKSEDRMPLKLD